MAADEFAPERLPAHPLVVGLTTAIVDGAPALAASSAALRAADTALRLTNAAKGLSLTVASPGSASYDELPEGPHRGHVDVVTGYLGGCVKDKKPVMQVLYLDARLATWLLIPLDGIVLFNRAEDKSAAFGLRDVLWLNPDVRVVRGDDTDAVQRSYLNGPFVRVDDIAPTATGGTFPRSGGLLLEATTPGCCTKTRP
jgi:hypothetical protein